MSLRRTVIGDLADWIARSSEIVIAECVARWHDELRAGGPEPCRAMFDGVVVPEVVARLRELLDDPELGGTAEDAMLDIGLSG
ncbi:hypothetical protein ABZ345_24075 [Lentzea sp. NPDC005914]|uniref:hypothetical protein n=1 Tax=Lentzea sp. NPDC005914 TaxID=3154572 RepID=UPI0033C7F883